MVIQTQGLDRFLNFDSETGVVQAMAGVTLEDIMNTAIPSGWFLPVVPGTRYVSLGGAVASNVHGKNHHHVGAFANFVDEIEVLTERGLFDLFFYPISRIYFMPH